MEDWETSYMKRLAEIASFRGGSVLELGYGMGISAGFIESNPDVDSHCVIECHPGVATKALTDFRDSVDKSRFHLLSGFWQDITPKLADGSFDAVVACLVFEHIEAVDAAIAEVARVLEPGGRFAFFLNHPLLQTPGSGWIDDQVLDPPEQYWRIGPYLVEDSSIEEVEKDVFIPFIHRPMSRYVNAMADAGLTLRRMHEPAPPPGFLARAAEYAEAASIPRLLVLVAEREGT